MKTIQKINFYFLEILLIFMPLQAFFSEFLTRRTDLSGRAIFWLAHFYEPILIVLAGISILQIIFERKKWQNWTILLYLLLLLGAISVFFISPSLGRGVEGFRVTLLFLLGIFIARDFTTEYAKKIVNIYLIVAIVIALWALLERLLPAMYWQHLFGANSVFGYGNFLAGDSIRSTSIFSGPNQLGSFLLPAVFLLLPKLTKQRMTVIWYSILILAIGFAFSRAAILGLAIALIAALLISRETIGNKLKIGLVSIIMVLIPFSFGYFDSREATVLITHGTSQEGHSQALTTTLAELKNRLTSPGKLFFGSGLSTAGPLTLKYGGGIISESWYLQLALELGLVGLLTWLLFIGATLKSFFEKDEKAFAFGLLAVSITALFLHTFADNPALSYTLFILIGAKLLEKKS